MRSLRQARVPRTVSERARIQNKGACRALPRHAPLQCAHHCRRRALERCSHRVYTWRKLRSACRCRWGGRFRPQSCGLVAALVVCARVRACARVEMCVCVCVCVRACVRTRRAGLQSHAGMLKSAQTRAYMHARTHQLRARAHTHTPIARARAYNRRDAQIRGPRPAAHCAQPRRLRGSSHAPRGTPAPPPRSCCRPSRCSLSFVCGHVGALLRASSPAPTIMSLMCLSA